MDGYNNFYKLPEKTYHDLVMEPDIQEIWNYISDKEQKRLGPIFYYFGRSPVRALNDKTLPAWLDQFSQYKNIEIPDTVECWPQMFLCNSCLLNILIHPILKYLGSVFYRCPQFENNWGGKIYYTGSKEDWKNLIYSYPDRKFLGCDYTDYDSIVEFVDADTFQLPEIDFHIIENDNGNTDEQIRYCAYSGDIVIQPSYIDQDGREHIISSIGVLSFAFNEGIESVVIPPEIRVIGPDAFCGCKNLKRVYICDSADIILIRDGAFLNCENLKHVHIGRFAHINQYAFAKTTGPKIEVEAIQDLTDQKYVRENAFFIKEVL